MIKCQACGTQNLDTSQFCDECGDALNKYQAPSVGDDQVRTSETRVDPEVPENPAFQSASATSVGTPAVVAADKTEANDTDDDVAGKLSKDVDRFMPNGVHANLVIERGQAIGMEFPLSADESYVGRWDADNGVFPDVDLDAHDPEAKVSRKHARITCVGNQYSIEDLGSTNGTFVNRGRRLIPGNPQVLKDGDEIIVGKTFLRFQIVR